MDDLVASLSSNHIGQEAMDLAALQAQLAQAFGQQASKESFTPHRCNTPTPRSPSTTMNWTPSLPLNRRPSTDDYMRDAEDMEDERMVEDLLMSTSPVAPRPRTAAECQSSFTTTDPFYLAQLQAMQHPAPPSVFAQLGRQTHASPFHSGTPTPPREAYQQHPREAPFGPSMFSLSSTFGH
ncbi:hypothetical protein CYLTODRAFT_486955 [Cylindrobasidium torrendii FP15055 ss-10]|uniref:Uncharacterized protein n=1 Tax=Cylindrobasidium torrendii FP15055 ss-10 TaxID=1314674 RepID=A0A0D7BNS5_9AGAR|nr:hypothetical protein CYLTODRAFT_486955 [Cylindrobasidium torrendii FP15055 ss-10]